MLKLGLGTARPLAESYRAGEGQRRAPPTVSEALANERKYNRWLCAIVPGSAGRLQAHADEELGALPLHGLPFTLKDVWPVAGLPTSAGNLRLAQQRAVEHGVVTQTLLAAGGVLVGKSNCSDRGLTPESASFVGGVTRNPWDLRRSPGGSSGGAAAAVAARMAAFDWGSDIGGSVRLPAAFCGVYGLRLSSRHYPPQGHLPPSPQSRGMMAMGPIAARLDVLSQVVRVIRPVLGKPPTEFPLRGLAIVVPDAFSRGFWPGFGREMRALARRLELELVPHGLPTPREMDRVFASFLASSFKLRHGSRHSSLLQDALVGFTVGRLTRRHGLHPQSARIVLELSALRLGPYRDAPGATQRLDALRDAAARLFERGVVLVTPTTTFPAPLLGRVQATRGIGAFVKLGNVLDATALTLPFGVFPQGLPRGLQLLGPPGAEDALCALAQRIAEL